MDSFIKRSGAAGLGRERQTGGAQRIRRAVKLLRVMLT